MISYHGLTSVFASCFQAIPAPQEEAPPADGAKAAKRPRLPSNNRSTAPPADTTMQMTVTPVCPQTSAPLAAPATAEHQSINTPPTSQPMSQDPPAPTNSTQMDSETPMDTSLTLSDALTGSTLASDPTLTPQSTPFGSTLNSDPFLSVPSPPLLPKHLSESYKPSSGYVSYMETLLNSHFPQDNGPGPLY